MDREPWARFLRLFRAASPLTKPRLLLFTASRALRRRLGRDVYRGGRFRFAFGNFVVSQGRGDLGTIDEVFGRGIYQVSGFEAREGDTCVDVGANIGCVTVLWRRTNRSGRIVAIEPHPAALAALRANLALNEEPLATAVVAAAAGATGGEVTVQVDADGQTMARHPGLEAAWGVPYRHATELKVPCRTLDELLEAEGIDHVDLMKIDVEGFEAECLAGARRSLARVDRLILEYHAPSLRSACLERLTAAGFAVEEHAPLLFARRTAAAGQPPRV